MDIARNIWEMTSFSQVDDERRDKERPIAVLITKKLNGYGYRS